MTNAEPVQGQVVLEISELSKTFGATRALRGVSLGLHSGEIVALCGQNGSGKSTLIKVLAGFHDADPGGEIRVHGHVVANTQQISGSSIHFIHQDLALVPTLSAVENLRLPSTRGWALLKWTNGKVETADAERKLAALGADFDVNLPVSRLTPAERTMVAIARATSGWTQSDNILVLDEPTASLHRGEVDRLFAAVRKLAAAGAGVIFVSHRLDEVEAIADRVVVFRDGRKVADVAMGDYSQQALVRHMVGGDVATVEKGVAALGRPALEINEVRGTRLEGVSFSVGEGEVLGLSGLIGSGVETLGATVFGARTRTSGTVLIGGRPLRRQSPGQSMREGFAYAPADRQTLGAIMTMNVRENLTLPLLRTTCGRAGQVKRDLEEQHAADWIGRLGVQPKDPELYMNQLSGGNQQKVVLAKWLRRNPRVLWLDEPTQGVDVGAKAAIHELIARAAADGMAVIVASTDAKELAGLCHRVIVLDEGQVVVELTGAAVTEEGLINESLGRASIRAAAHHTGAKT